MNDKQVLDIIDSIEASGASLVSTAYIGDIVPRELSQFKYAFSIVYKLCDYIMQGAELPTHQYFQHYRMVNTQLDLYSIAIVREIEKLGYTAYPVAASQSIPTELDKYSAAFSHKAVAIRSGLGYVGKSGLFVTQQWGSAVRLASVLTDMELPAHEMASSKCGECDMCVSRCPASALTGAEYIVGNPRETVVNARKCSEHMKTAYQHIGRGVVCGKCICYGRNSKVYMNNSIINND